MPFRLQILKRENVPQDFRDRFVHRTDVDVWKDYLGAIQDLTLCRPQKANIAHRLQVMEFEAALILCDRESACSTLMATIKRFKFQTYSILANSVFEGIGSALFQQENSRRPNTTREWQASLAHRVEIEGGLEKISTVTQRRDMIHVDRVEDNDNSQFIRLTYERSFYPTYSTFREVLSALNPAWPQGCVLNEQIETDGQGFSAIPICR